MLCMGTRSPGKWSVLAQPSPPGPSSRCLTRAILRGRPRSDLYGSPFVRFLPPRRREIMRWSQLPGRSLPAAASAVATMVFAGLVAVGPAAAQFGVVPGVGPTAPPISPPSFQSYTNTPSYQGIPSYRSQPSYHHQTPSYQHTPSYHNRPTYRSSSSNNWPTQAATYQAQARASRQHQTMNDWSSRTQRQANSYQTRASQQHQAMSRRTEMRLQQERNRRQIQQQSTQRYYPRSGRSLFFRRTSVSVGVYPSSRVSPRLTSSGVDALSLK